MLPSLRSVCATFIGIAVTLPSYADSFTSSAASTASQSVGSASTSLQGSSASSQSGSALIEGDYDVTRVAPVPEKPGVVRMHLQRAAARLNDGDAAAARGGDADRASARTDFTLDLPQAALGERGIAAGEVVSLRHRPYGYEFARARTREPFFLVLADAWMRELEARPI